MPNIQSVLKAEISRLARKEVRDELAAVKKASGHYRSQIAALRRQVDALQKTVKRLTRTGAAARERTTSEDDAEGRLRRFSSARLTKHRQKLGLSAADFGALMGVSGQSIYKWEAGEVRPRRKQLEAIAQLRTLGKREAAARLEVLRAAPR
jgi:DNA-binding transcriptional regulator YiaG